MAHLKANVIKELYIKCVDKIVVLQILNIELH
jgi:hypothetical protein